uniref:Uncharacterized protein n=1 Tax=Arundo donax TaxID=35708 RepID=A0A0A9HNZ2_ARUDO
MVTCIFHFLLQLESILCKFHFLCRGYRNIIDRDRVPLLHRTISVDELVFCG